MYTNAEYQQNPWGQPEVIRIDINGVTSFVRIGDDNPIYLEIMQLVAEGKLTLAPAEGAN